MARNYTPSCLNLKNWLTSKKHVSTCLKKKLLTLDRVIITLARSTKEWKASSKILRSVWRTKRRLGEKLMHSPAYKSSPLSIRSMSGPTCRPRVAPLWRSWLALIKRMLLCLGTTGPMGPIRPNSNRKLTRVGKGAHLERRLRTCSDRQVANNNSHRQPASRWVPQGRLARRWHWRRWIQIRKTTSK